MQNNTVQKTEVIRDPDEMFLLSQLPNIKKIRPHDKMDFQMKFLELVHAYSNQDSPPEQIFSQTSTSLTSIPSEADSSLEIIEES